MKKGSLWPWVIGVALAVHIIASLVVVAIATSDPSYAVEEDYYQKALAWDDKLEQDRTNESLGWSLDFTVERPAQPGDQPIVEATLFDDGGNPLTGAAVLVETFHKARSDDILRSLLDEGEDGAYSTRLPMRRDGRWELRFTVDRGTEHFTYTETRHLFVEGSW